jgi:hypothetical protein
MLALVAVLVPGIGKLTAGMRCAGLISAVQFQPSEFAKLAFISPPRISEPVDELREPVNFLKASACCCCRSRSFSKSPTSALHWSCCPRGWR